MTHPLLLVDEKIFLGRSTNQFKSLPPHLEQHPLGSSITYLFSFKATFDKFLGFTCLMFLNSVVSTVRNSPSSTCPQFQVIYSNTSPRGRNNNINLEYCLVQDSSEPCMEFLYRRFIFCFCFKIQVDGLIYQVILNRYFGLYRSYYNALLHCIMYKTV